MISYDIIMKLILSDLSAALITAKQDIQPPAFYSTDIKHDFNKQEFLLRLLG